MPDPSSPPQIGLLSPDTADKSSVSHSNVVNEAHHPRIAVLLGINHFYHLPLLFFRSLSTAPAVWLALTLFPEIFSSIPRNHQGPWPVDRRFEITETFLAILWCCASAYLSFFFTDCLMSRWLLNYTPQATLIRLLAITSTNAYATSWIIYLFGGGASNSPRQTLPAMISISSILIVLYRITQRNANIRREISTSMSIFSFASFFSMISLLLQLYITRQKDTPIPLVLFAKLLWERARDTGLVDPG